MRTNLCFFLNKQRLAELEKAHMIQAALVQRLQQTKQRIAVYKVLMSNYIVYLLTLYLS
jgi:hypothetical protein